MKNVATNDTSQERVDKTSESVHEPVATLDELMVDRNEVLEEVAKEFEKMPFGDTSASFAIFVRNMKT